MKRKFHVRFCKRGGESDFSIDSNSNCGHVLKELDLSVREWRCPSCQSVNGRDENAAKNICAVGASTALR
ncbi:zinc ribbon domain-containing protein [Microcoleus sp. Aus8_D1]